MNDNVTDEESDFIFDHFDDLMSCGDWFYVNESLRSAMYEYPETRPTVLVAMLAAILPGKSKITEHSNFVRYCREVMKDEPELELLMSGLE